MTTLDVRMSGTGRDFSIKRAGPASMTEALGVFSRCEILDAGPAEA